MMMGLWFILFVPFSILMMVVGNRRRNAGEDEEVGCGTYHGQEEEEEGDGVHWWVFGGKEEGFGG